jgi:hypothetical protein
MNVIEGDFLEVHKNDWRKADLLFINASCYGDEILNDIMKLSSEFTQSMMHAMTFFSNI